MFSEKIRHAIKIVEALEKKKLMNGADLAKAAKLSYSYFQPTVAVLVKSGCVSTVRGCNGGYSINRDKRECGTISLWDIISAFEPNLIDEEGALAPVVVGIIVASKQQTFG